jgi:hypothetical protein
VRDPGGLKVEVGDHGVVHATRGSSTQCRQSSRRRLLRRGDELPRRVVVQALRLGHLASKCVCRRALVLLEKGSHTHVLLGGGSLGLGSRKSCGKGTISAGDSGGTRRRRTERSQGACPVR